MLKIFFLIPTSQREKEKGKKLPIFHHIIISIINTMMMMKIRNNLQCLVLLLLSHIFLWLTSTKIKMKTKRNETKTQTEWIAHSFFFLFFWHDIPEVWIFQKKRLFWRLWNNNKNIKKTCCLMVVVTIMSNHHQAIYHQPLRAVFLLSKEKKWRKWKGMLLLYNTRESNQFLYGGKSSLSLSSSSPQW